MIKNKKSKQPDNLPLDSAKFDKMMKKAIGVVPATTKGKQGNSDK